MMYADDSIVPSAGTFREPLAFASTASLEAMTFAMTCSAVFVTSIGAIRSCSAGTLRLPRSA